MKGYFQEYFDMKLCRSFDLINELTLPKSQPNKYEIIFLQSYNVKFRVDASTLGALNLQHILTVTNEFRYSSRKKQIPGGTK